jgi:hypothetical protein
MAEGKVQKRHMKAKQHSSDRSVEGRAGYRAGRKIVKQQHRELLRGR